MIRGHCGLATYMIKKYLPCGKLLEQSSCLVAPNFAPVTSKDSTID